ncbi:MAG: Rieske (2Fe-2S) protein [Bacteroidetes bacterium]|nr:Rieske (2Fe-2S) protein [Bacteroidota bacterium]
MKRKEFLKTFGWLIALPYLLFAGLMVRKHRQVSSARIIRLKTPNADGIYFYDDVIMIQKDQKLKLFSSKCTHLGCRINKIENGQLVCPCHGSSFGENGEVISGPATTALTELTYKFDPEKKELITEV